MTAHRLDAETESMVRGLAGLLEARGISCATAESCTGGWIAQTLTTVPGSSNWFDCGFVTYSNEAKMRHLGVKAESLERFGAVSEAVASEMALGALTNSGARSAVSVTGVAGPDGGSPDKPVGTVVFGWIVPGMDRPDVESVLFNGDRADIRWGAVVHAISGLTGRLRKAAFD